MKTVDREAERSEGGKGDGRDGDGDGLNMWEDNVANVILGIEPYAFLDSAPALELHHPNMNILGGHGGQLSGYSPR